MKLHTAAAPEPVDVDNSDVDEQIVQVRGTIMEFEAMPCDSLRERVIEQTRRVLGAVRRRNTPNKIRVFLGARGTPKRGIRMTHEAYIPINPADPHMPDAVRFEGRLYLRGPGGGQYTLAADVYELAKAGELE